ncbi:pickpocket protein 28-like [Bradysia coprophila]|uniref:pickpocket protein 28-like n=1 Tax=Bradysia coprophila TaxID=38358 RepID=UPI00187D707C|nr:pickpocket protein 28-like [Bradysia coprophila]
MILCVTCSIIVSKEVYNKWQKSPVIVSFAEKYTRVSEIPFPSVTICPETKARSSILNFTQLYNRWMEDGVDALEKEEEENLRKMVAVLQLCSDSLNEELNETGRYNFTDNKIFEIIKEVAPSFDETLVNCKFQNREEHCRDYFEEVITEEGLCYTFNSLEPTQIYREREHRHELFDALDRTKKTIDNWSLDDGYTSLNNRSYPLRVFGSGVRDGLAVTFSLNRSEFDETCRSHVQGFKIQLHMPGVFPQLTKHYFHLPMKRDVLVAVNPHIIKTDEDLVSYGHEVRQCYFSDEKWLQFFRFYTKENCDFECLTNHTLLACGCVRFSMPRTKDTKICGIKKIDCCIRAEDELLRKDDGLLGSNVFDDCNCLPSCTSYTYGVEQSHNIIKSKAECSHCGSIEKETAIVRIFFNKKQFISSKRSKLYGHIELLANFGGLLGLFLGISLLSFVEIIYFFTLRTYLLVKRKILPINSSTDKSKMKSNEKMNGIRSSVLNDPSGRVPLAKKGMALFAQRRRVSSRKDIVREGF